MLVKLFNNNKSSLNNNHYTDLILTDVNFYSCIYISNYIGVNLRDNFFMSKIDILLS